MWIMSAASAASSIVFTFIPSSTAFCQDEPPSLRPTITFNPLSAMFLD